jgi:hypothetical protein
MSLSGSPLAHDGKDFDCIALVAVSPNYPTDMTVFATAVDGGIYRSTNGGKNWSLLQRFDHSQ